jgi:hypothetical protein
MTIRSYETRGQVLYTLATGTPASASNAMGLLQEVQLDHQFGGAIAMDAGLALEQDVDVFGYEYPASEMGLTQTVTYHNTTVAPVMQATGFNLQSEATFKYGVRNLSVESVMGLTQSANTTKEYSVTTVMGLTQEAFRSYTPSNDLALTNIVEWGYGFDAESILGLVETLEFDQVLNKSMTESLDLEQAVAWFIENPCARYQFKQFHGTGGVAPQDQKLNYTNTFLIQSLDDGQVVELRNPETDNRRRYAFNRVNRRFLDGTPDVYSDDNWVTEQTQIYTIVALKRADLDTLFTFLLDNLGREVLVKDWKGVTWIVIITNPGEVYTEDGEGRWTIEFEVVGESVDGEYLVEHMGLDSDLSRAGSIYTRQTASTDGLTTRVLREPFPIDAGMALSGAASFTIVGP